MTESVVRTQEGSLRWLAAAAGSVVIGVTLPVLLVCWHSWPLGPAPEALMDDADKAYHQQGDLGQFVFESIKLQISATLVCGPGAVILSLLLYAGLRKVYTLEEANVNLPGAMLLGAGTAFFNLPGFGAGLFVSQGRVVLLFLASGATCGCWIGYQAWRDTHPDADFRLRFSLKSLLLLVIAWGALLLIFAPRSHSA